MTIVYFYKSDDLDSEITSIEYPSYPRFEIGDTIHLEVKNNDPKTWDVEPLLFTTFTVEKVEHSALKYYGSNVNFQTHQIVYLKESVSD